MKLLFMVYVIFVIINKIQKLELEWIEMRSPINYRSPVGWVEAVTQKSP